MREVMLATDLKGKYDKEEVDQDVFKKDDQTGNKDTEGTRDRGSDDENDDEKDTEGLEDEKRDVRERFKDVKRVDDGPEDTSGERLDDSNLVEDDREHFSEGMKDEDINVIVSQLKKDKIWPRRIKPNKREVQILVALVESSSMPVELKKQTSKLRRKKWR
jgi:hypothetical protein